MISRDHFDAYPLRRYSVGETPSVRIDQVSLRKLYDDFGEVITAADLEGYDIVTGDVRYVLEYYRVADELHVSLLYMMERWRSKNRITDSSPMEEDMKPRALQKRRPEASVWASIPVSNQSSGGSETGRDNMAINFTSGYDLISEVDPVKVEL